MLISTMRLLGDRGAKFFAIMLTVLLIGSVFWPKLSTLPPFVQFAVVFFMAIATVGLCVKWWQWRAHNTYAGADLETELNRIVLMWPLTALLATAAWQMWQDTTWGKPLFISLASMTFVGTMLLGARMLSQARKQRPVTRSPFFTSKPSPSA